MKVGDLVSVLYETTRYYIVVEALPRRGNAEIEFKLFNINDGSTRFARYSEIKTISKAKKR